VGFEAVARLLRGVQHLPSTADTQPVSLLSMDLRLLSYFVAVAEERNFGRAAARLHMTQPPLSRAIQQLEAEFKAVLLARSPAGVTLTSAGAVLYEEARALLDRAEEARARVAAATGTASITIGVLADSGEQAGTRLAAAFRRRHPDAGVRVHEAGLTDPTAGLRSGLADVALTRAPFDTTGIRVLVLRSDPVGVLLRADDPLARRDRLHLAELAGRPWFQLPEGTDPVWRAYWNGTQPGDPLHEGPVVRTVHECVQGVLWNGTVGLTPLGDPQPDGLAAVEVADLPPSQLVLAWREADPSPLVRSFAAIAADTYRG
jgi:DNA-binding transcriptional LysR family regulator